MVEQTKPSWCNLHISSFNHSFSQYTLIECCLSVVLRDGNSALARLDSDTPPPAPTWGKMKDRCLSAVQKVKLKSVRAEQIQSQNRTDVLRASVLVSILRASPGLQVPLSPGDDIGPLFC